MMNALVAQVDKVIVALSVKRNDAVAGEWGGRPDRNRESTESGSILSFARTMINTRDSQSLRQQKWHLEAALGATPR
jgi:hypothetical protein